MKRNNSNEWVRYLDNKSNCYYWYSNKTGETYWDEENNNDNNNDNDNNYQEEVEEEEKEVVEEDDIHLTNIRNPHAQDYSDEDDDDDDDIEEQKNHQYSENDNQNDNYSDDDENDDDENEQLISNLIQKDILFQTQQDITFFTYCFIIHALVIEAPLCIIESFIRSFIFFILSLFYLFIFILSFPLSLLIQNINKSPNYPNNNNHDTISTTISSSSSTTTTTTKSSLPSLLYISIFLFIESLISFSLGLSFIIPGIILIIYRDFNGIDEWKLHPIPSIMGWIDPRRLAVITLGQGSSANNSSAQWKLISSSNNISSIFISEKKVEIMDSIKLNIYQNESTIFHQPFCFPRDILSFLRSNRP